MTQEPSQRETGIEINQYYYTVFHIIERIKHLETRLTKLQTDISEILRWVDHGKIATSVASKAIRAATQALLWLVKVVTAVTVLSGASAMLHHGGALSDLMLMRP